MALPEDTTDPAMLEQLKSGLRSVTPFSNTVQTVLRLLGEKPFDINKICQCIELDPILASAILRLANSPFYGFARKIALVKDAAVLLGVHTLRQVVISFSVVNAFPLRGGGALDREALWRHCVGVAVGAKLLAETLGQDGDEAFIAGIIHDIGQLIMDQCLPDQYQQVLERAQAQAGGLYQLEQQLIGVDHGRVGAVAIQHWQLPAALARAAVHHNYPAVERQREPLVDLIHVADVLAQGLWFDGGEPATIERLSPQVLTRLGLSWEQIEALLPKIDNMSQEMIGRLLC